MRIELRRDAIVLLTAALMSACTMAPTGAPAPREVGVLPADARALRYGATAPEVFANPEMRDKVRALFGSDWAPAAQGGGRLQHGAVAYFPPDSKMRMIRIDGRDYIAISGCVQNACPTHRGLVLIQPDGEQLWARVDEGGFARYYGHGPAMTATPVSPAYIDSAWRALERVERV